jgi:membrane dipeptidase
MKTVDKGVRVDQDLTGKTHSDLDRWKKGGLMFKYSVYCDGGVKTPMQLPTGKWTV